ncbi:hypothetical protein C3L33_15272, partial [Rhododendron williamsianum]
MESGAAVRPPPRPKFDKKTGDLYIADAYYGLLVVGAEGGIATSLATHVEGEKRPIFFANDLESITMVPSSSQILASDTTARHFANVLFNGGNSNFLKYRDHFVIMLEGEATGRLLRIMKYWLEGPKTGTVEEHLLQTPIRLKYLARFMGMKMYTVISLFNDKGEVLDVLEDRKGKVMKLVSEVRETKGKLWIGTVAHNHIATLPYP